MIQSSLLDRIVLFFSFLLILVDRHLTIPSRRGINKSIEEERIKIKEEGVERSKIQRT